MNLQILYKYLALGNIVPGTDFPKRPKSIIFRKQILGKVTYPFPNTSDLQTLLSINFTAKINHLHKTKRRKTSFFNNKIEDNLIQPVNKSVTYLPVMDVP